MAVSELLRLIVDADTSGAVRGINTLGAATKRELSRSEKSIQKWSSALTSVGAGMVAIGAVGVVGLGRAAMAAEDAQLSVVKLENTLQNMPQLAGESSAQFIDLADSIQDVTAADADQIVAAEAMLGTFKLTADEIKDITPLVVDYARKFGVDLVSAATQVGKALDGNAGALMRNGVSIDQAAFAADRYTAVQEALATQVGGFAEAEGKTFAGSVQRMKNELGDLAEGVGVGAVDAFSSMFSVVQGVTDRFNKLSPATQGLVGKIATFASVGLVASGGMSILVGQAIKMRDTFGTIKDAITGVTTRIRTLGAAGTALTSLPAILVAVGAGFEMWNQQQQRLNIDRLTAEFLAAGDSASGMEAAIQSAADNGPTELIGLFTDLASTNREAAERFIDTAEAAGVAGSVIAQMRGHLETTAAAEAQTAEDTAALASEMEGQAGATEDATSALQEYSDQLSALVDPLFGMVDALGDNRDAQTEVAAAQQAVNDARAAGDPAALTEAELRLAEAHRAAAGTALDVATATAVLQDGVEAGTVSVEDAQAQLETWVRQGLISRDTANVMAFAFGGAAAQADNLAGDYRVGVHTSGLAGVMAELAGLDLKIRQLDGSTITVNANLRATSTGRIGGVPVFHEGGVVKGAPRGTELLALVQAGEGIIDLDTMRALQSNPGRAVAAVAASSPGRQVVELRVVGGSGAASQFVTRMVRTGEIQLNVNGQRVKAG